MFCLCLSKRTISIFLYKIKVDNCYYEKVCSEVKNIEDEIPFEIPDSWCWVRLKQICKNISDGTHKTPIYVDKGIPFLSVKDISNGYIDFSKTKYISQEEHFFLTQRCKPEENDVLICRIGTLGKAIKINCSNEFSIFVSLGLIKPIISEIADYLVTIINSGYGFSWIEKNKVGGGTHTFKINLEDLRMMLLPIPPLNEQKRIINNANNFNSLIEKYHLLEHEKTKLDGEIYEKLKKSILQYAIQGKLVEQDENDEPASVLLERIRAEKKAQLGKKYVESYIYKGDDNCYYEHIGGKDVNITEEIPYDLPSGWVWSRLDDLALYKKGPFGSSLTKDMFVPKSATSIKVYEQKNAIYKNCLLGEYFISESKYETMKSFEVFPKDIIVSCAGTIGETYVLPDEAPKGIINQALMKIKLFNQNIVDFYLIYFDYILKGQAQKSSKGSAIKNIPPFDILKKMLMPIPPLKEQERIVNKINEIFAKL